jgi:hypothetical protein
MVLSHESAVSLWLTSGSKLNGSEAITGGEIGGLENASLLKISAIFMLSVAAPRDMA